MPSFFSSNKSSSTDPNIRQEEKRIASDEHVDQKSLNHAINDLKKAEKTHLHAVKASDKAQHALDKAVKNEHKAATTLNNSQHKHEASIMDEANAEKTLELNREHQSRLEQDLQQRRSDLDEVQHRKDVNDQTRETTLSGIHARAASRAGSRADSAPHAPYPVDRGATTGSETMSAESFATASDGVDPNSAPAPAMPQPDVGQGQKGVSFV